MPRGADEPVPAGDVGQGGTAELAEGADDRPRLQRAAIVKGEIPDRAVFIELGRRDAAAETQMRAKAALGDQRVQVSQDLLARRELRLQRQGRNENEYKCDGTSQARPG